MRMHRRRLAHGAMIVLLAGALNACSFGPKMTEQPASYDLGPLAPAASSNSRIAETLMLPEVTAPAWLSGNGIVYRLVFENASRPQTYTMSRWTARGPAVGTHRLRSRFAAAAPNGIVTGADGVRADYLLRVELEDFSQSFDTPASSRGTVQARAGLIGLTERKRGGQREFGSQ